MTHTILTINPGSTSTKIGIYHDTSEVYTRNLSHSASELAAFPTIQEQLPYRLQAILTCLADNGIALNDLAAIVGRGGLLKPLVSGTYRINQAMLDDLTVNRYGAHASNLGAVLAHQLAAEAGCPSFIVDPVVVDELAPVARISGRPELPRRSVFHALNQKAVAKRFARSQNRPYNELNLIVAHLGGGISVGCHLGGRVVEVNNALDGEGPFSPERAGTLPAGQWASLIQSGQYPSADIPRLIAGQGGLVAHLGLNDVRQVQDRIAQGDEQANAVYQAMIYQIARSIAAAAVPACGKIDYILLTGGIAYSEYITNKLREYTEFIAPVVVLPGEDELQALAEGAYRVLTGEESACEY